ncbi:MAG: hypothetical protein HY021_15490 [Burkholderiales bacterium]|nr:hypothetical protein [Burkholderiales bacterium]
MALLGSKSIIHDARRWVLAALLGGALLAPAMAAPYHWQGGHGGHGGLVFRGGFWPGWGWGVVALPIYATVVTVGALNYWYADGVYYRAVPAGGYVAVAPPPGLPAAPVASERVFVYPRNGQSANQQAGDEYDCHRWAVTQSGFDPVAGATSTATDASKKGDYARAQAACLDGRGYTVR